ncbi:MAG TPA: hypothetical protein VII95_20080 [Terriglobales bacterium]|jgi:hypothetical protein
MTTEAEACAVQDKLVSSSLLNFNNAARAPVYSIGVGRDNDGYYVHIGLERQPTAQEQDSIPNQVDGVRVKWQVIGQIRPL